MNYHYWKHNWKKSQFFSSNSKYRIKGYKSRSLKAVLLHLWNLTNLDPKWKQEYREDINHNNQNRKWRNKMRDFLTATMHLHVLHLFSPNIGSAYLRSIYPVSYQIAAYFAECRGFRFHFAKLHKLFLPPVGSCKQLASWNLPASLHSVEAQAEFWTQITA